MIDVGVRAIKNVKWTALGEIVSRSIGPILVLILARILTPSDFGIVAAAMVIIGFVGIFQEFGLGKALIHYEGEIDKSANVIFWTNVSLSILLYLILFITAPLISSFFHEPELVNVLRVLCIQIILFSFTSVHQALFRRQFQFKQLFFIRLFSSVIPGLVSIPLALSGYGVWALVCGTLAGSTVRLLLIWKASSWRPQLSYNFRLARQLLGFGGWITLEGLLGWLMVSGDSVILGHYLGVGKLGIYRVGVTFLSLVSGLIFNPIFPVIYSSFCRLQSDISQLRSYYLKATRLIATIVLPVGITVALLAKPISLVLFGGKWKGIETVILIIGIKDVLTSIGVGISVDTVRAIGRPDVNVKLFALSAICFVPTYILAAPHGLLVFCIARFFVGIFTVLIYVPTIVRFLKVPFIYPLICAKTQLVTVFIMGIVVYLFSRLIAVEGWLELVSAVMLALLSYVSLLRLIDAGTFRSTLGYMHAVLKS